VCRPGPGSLLLRGHVREVVARNLARFRSGGLIRVEDHRVQIVNRAGLEQEAEAQG
jgi:hypothetical protein